MSNPTGGEAPARIVASRKDYRNIGLPLAIQSLKQEDNIKRDFKKCSLVCAVDYSVSGYFASICGAIS